jgi:hypothetical protein
MPELQNIVPNDRYVVAERSEIEGRPCQAETEPARPPLPSPKVYALLSKGRYKRRS